MCGGSAINVLVIAEAGAFLAAAAFGASLTNVVLLSVLTVYSVASGNEQKLMTYVSLLSTALLGLCVTYGAYGEVTVSGDKGSKTISTENVSKGSSSELTRVGRWMSQEEYEKMSETGMVQESHSGTTHVANPASMEAFGKQAKIGQIYVEFDVPIEALKQTNERWAKILGPNTIEARLAVKKGNPVPQMPSATNIKIVGKK